jgi:cytosine/adenosine deaminase-related metal-dependent hydrolase
MILHNLNIINNGTKTIKIDGERIAVIYANNANVDNRDQTHLYFDNCLAFAGLINSHDHLDFNSFPQLGNRVYKNYLDWGNDIHLQNKAAIQAVLNIPKTLRTHWGMYKNLLNGVTTVMQHGEQLVLDNAPINIFNQCHSLHSVRLEKNWKFKLNKPFIPNYPFVIHAGEGTDESSFKEINRLLRWNIFNRKLIGIHGVAMTPEQAQQFEALIWCPDSNFFLLDKTAAINKLKTVTKIIFGTDSTVSASWSILQQLRNARATALLTDQELMDAVSSSAAAIWKLGNTGRIKENYYADIVVVQQKEPADSNADTFFSSNPEDILLILNKGNIVLFDESLLTRLNNIILSNYSKVYIKGKGKYVIGDLPGLIREMKKFAPEITFPVETD